MNNYPSLCPRYQKCSVNRCPVSEDLKKLTDCEGDPERVCKMHLRTRLEIKEQALKDGVALQGLTDKEKRSGVKIEALLAEWDEKNAKRDAHLNKMRELKGS